MVQLVGVDVDVMSNDHKLEDRHPQPQQPHQSVGVSLHTNCLRARARQPSATGQHFTLHMFAAWLIGRLGKDHLEYWSTFNAGYPNFH